MKPISIHEFLWEPSKYPAKEVCVVFGEDAFLKFHAARMLRDQVLDGEDAEFSLTRLEGDSVGINDVLKEVSTRAMFGSGRRFVQLEDADGFVSKFRAELEDYVDRPSKQSVLLLQLKSFPNNTRLFKKIVETGLIVEAKALSDSEIPKWIVRWAKQRHRVDCKTDAARLLLDRVGPEYGLLDQELAKLALMVLEKGSITTELVEKGVGSWRSQTTFEMLDLALSGQTAAAVAQLDKLILAGENAIGILAQISATLRKMGTATQVILEAEKNRRKMLPAAALKQVGIKGYFVDKTEKQLLKLGRHRGKKILDWLLQADLDLKGASRSDPRLILETLIVRISDPRLRMPENRPASGS